MKTKKSISEKSDKFQNGLIFATSTDCTGVMSIWFRYDVKLKSSQTICIIYVCFTNYVKAATSPLKATGTVKHCSVWMLKTKKYV